MMMTRYAILTILVFTVLGGGYYAYLQHPKPAHCNRVDPNAAVAAISKPLSEEMVLHNNNGVKKLVKEDFEGSFVEFDKALRLKPDYKLARENKAIGLNNYALKKNRDGDQRGALALFEAAHQLDPNNAITLENLGNMKKYLGDEKSGAVDIANAAKLKADQAAAKEEEEKHYSYGDAFYSRDLNEDSKD